MATINPVNIGTTPDDGTGDPLRSAFNKINGNEASLNSDISTRQVAPNNRVVINQLSDFPTPSAGVITLLDNTEYWIGDQVDVGSNRFVMGSHTVIAGPAAGTSMITSSTTGTLFTGTDVIQNTFQDISIDAANAKIFSYTDTTPGTSIFAILNSRIENSSSLGDFTDLLSVNIFNSGAFNTIQGFRTFGNINVISIRQFFVNSSSASFKGIDLGTSVAPTLEITDLVVVAPAGAFGISGLASNGNVTTGSIASVTSCEFLSGVTPLQNITVDDVRWRFQANSGISDTLPSALMFFNGNATETVISTTDVYVKVNAVWTDQISSHFTISSDGRLTYNGERPLTIYIDTIIDVLSAASNNITQIALFKNGSLEVAGIESEASTTDPANLYIVWQTNLVKDDFLEIFVRNRDNTQNLIAVNGTASVR